MEDPIDAVVAPRLEAAGADLSKVAILGGVKETGPDGENVALLQLPRNLNLIRAKCVAHGPALLVIDPLFAVLGYDEQGRYIKASDDQSVRRLTGRLKKLAEDLGITILLVRHLNKASGGNAIKRGSGSIAIGGQARAVMIVGRDPNEQSNGRVLAMTKNNFAPLPRSLLFNVVGLASPDAVAEDLVKSKASDYERREALNDAIYFLRHTIGSQEHAWDDLVQLAKKEGISEGSLRRARTELCLCKRFVGEHKCVWRLPMGELIKLGI